MRDSYRYVSLKMMGLTLCAALTCMNILINTHAHGESRKRLLDHGARLQAEFNGLLAFMEGEDG